MKLVILIIISLILFSNSIRIKNKGDIPNFSKANFEVDSQRANKIITKNIVSYSDITTYTSKSANLSVKAILFKALICMLG